MDDDTQASVSLKGLEVYRVGGAVRDRLLGLPVNDNDWVVVGATPEDMLARGFRPVGRDFPVFLHPHSHEEYALARTERKSGHGYAGFSVHASPEVTLEDDLRRRDLTVNAMAEASDGGLIDPYGGQQDLVDRRLRHVSDAFGEDPLRVLRSARFLARFAGMGFVIAPETLQRMARMCASGELEHLAAERVWGETERALGEGDPSAFFHTLEACHGLGVWWPELEGVLDDGLDAMRSAPCGPPGPAWWRLALLVSVMDAGSRHRLATRLKLPTAVARLADHTALTLALMARLKGHEGAGAADDIKQWFDRLDGWRKPEQVDIQLAFWAQQDSGLAGALAEAFQAGRSVDPKALIKSGYRGAEIGQALSARRRDIIARRLGAEGPSGRR